MPADGLRIEVAPDGPLRVTGATAVLAADGRALDLPDVCHLCRCGGSRTKPQCDATHGLKGWVAADPVPGDPPAAQPVVAATEPGRPGSVRATPDGPLEVTGPATVVDSGAVHVVEDRATLCRCGRSGHPPFCDGTHVEVGFRDPVPADEQVPVPTLHEALGGTEALERLTEAFYAGILGDPDPLLEPVFRGMDPDHPRHVAAWLAEVFGGPADYTAARGGYEHMVAAHRDRALTEPMRQAWLGRLLRTADEVGLTGDPDVRSALVAYLEWGSRIAVFNSAPGAAVIEHAPVPRWGWGESAPWVPQPWE